MSNPDPDLEWVRRCAKGDEAALRHLVAQYQSLVFGFARRYLGSAEDAEEVAASTFLKLWRTAASFRGECSVRSYLCQIALNLCRDRPPTRPLPTPCPPAKGGSPLADRVIAALQHMNPEDREVLVLYYLDELEYEEICAALNLGYDVLRTRLVRARKRLRTLVEMHDE